MNLELDPFVMLVASVLMPIATSIIIRPGWSANAKTGVGLLVGAAFGLAAAWWQEMWNREGIAFSITAVWGLGQLAQARMLQPTGVSELLENGVNSGRKPLESAGNGEIVGENA